MTAQTLLFLTAMSLAGPLALPAAAHTATQVIKMTANGFEPREVTVDENTTVNFVNEDSVDRWPASNTHPTHELHPEFDPQHAIPPGDLWIFKPKRIGTWKYHDHLYPHRRGTLTVTAESVSASPAAPTVTQSPSPTAAPIDSVAAPSGKTNWRAWLKQFAIRFWQAFIRPFRLSPVISPAAFQNLNEQAQYDHLRQLSQLQGAPAAWAYVKTTYTSDAGASLGGRAHDLAHFVGGLIFKAKGLPGLTVCDTTFAFGCYHGFTESAFADSLEPLLEVAQACTTLAPPNSGPWASCIHGIGHGVATYFDSANLEGALGACHKLSLGATFCHDGVLMEFSFSAPPNFYRADNPLYPCTDLPAQYHNACGRNQPHVMQRRLNMNRAAIGGVCLTAPPAVAEACLDSLGFAAANESRGNPEAILQQCGELPTPAARARCVGAGAGELIFQNFPGWQTSAPAACRTLPPEFQPACSARLEETRRNYQPNVPFPPPNRSFTPLHP